ncbi:MAG: hypothetical protein MJ185_01880 [Treponema sp.]|nr:hypothetical protein [Treponema sp.]
MKKVLLSFLLFFGLNFIFATSFKISEVIYEINGITKESVLRKKVPINENRIFNTEDEIIKYLSEIQKDLVNTRCFEHSEVTYEYSDSDDNESISVKVKISVTDSFHFLALPYLKYSSVNGLSLKLKAKDSNFIGTMNELNTSLDFQFEPDEEGTPFKVFEPELNISFDYPFNKGLFDLTWINNYSLSYTWGETSPEWDLKTGFKFERPFSNTTLTFAFYQGFIKDFYFRESNDETFFRETLEMYSPVALCEIPGYNQLKLIPKLSLIYNWDPFYKNGPSGIFEPTLKSPELSYSTGLSFGKINWDGNFRYGLESNLTPKLAYNFASHADNRVMPWSFVLFSETRFYNSFKSAGIYAQGIAFSYIQTDKTYGDEKIDGYIRGVIDSKRSLFNIDRYQAQVPSALILNLDFPVKIFSTDWENFPITKKIGFMKHFNFEFQLNPFFDIALIKTTEETHGTSNTFKLNEGFYGTGLEVLVFPQKWSSYVIRASVGIDAGRKIFKLNNEWRNNDCRPFEITIGLGTHY